MGIYERLGVRPIINATGTFTRLGGSLMPAEVLEAMVEASKEFVCIEELQLAAGKVIAEATGAEAGFVSTGAYSGIVLSIAACMTGLDPEKMNRLPNTEGMRNQVIMQKAHRNSYDHAVEVAGAKIVEVGLAHGCQPGEMEAAITEKTVAIFYLPGRPREMLPLEEAVRIGHRHGVPIVVDGAGRLIDDPGCLGSFVATGADLVVFSGGKYIRGPQSTGIIAGRRDLISAIALQQLDMDVTPGVWTVPPELIPVEKLPFIPRMGIGRGFKAGKEEIVGLIVALRLFAKRDHEDQRRLWAEKVQKLVDSLASVPQVKAEFLAAGTYRRGVPLARLRLDTKALGMSGREFLLKLKLGDPPIHPIESEIDQGNILVNPWGLAEGDPERIAKRIREIVAQAKA